MTDAVPAAEPRARGWGLLIAALVAFLLLPPAFAIILPVTRGLLLMLPALGALMVVGWLAGGSLMLAVAWVAVAIVAVAVPPSAGVFDTMQRAWSVLLAGGFGLILALDRRRGTFTARGLGAAAIALVAVVAVSLVRQDSSTPASSVLRTEYAARVLTRIAAGEAYFASPEWAKSVQESPGLADFGKTIMEQLQPLPEIAAGYAAIAPAMLALQSLMALALAWSLYHRISRTALGPVLGPLRDFRFNDQLVWGLVAGLALVLIPDAPVATTVGANLLVFFGGLYALRGLGVLWWFLKPGRTMTVLLVLTTLLAFPVAVPAVVSLALGLGVIDTWLDWRNRVRMTPQSSE